LYREENPPDRTVTDASNTDISRTIQAQAAAFPDRIIAVSNLVSHFKSIQVIMSPKRGGSVTSTIIIRELALFSLFFGLVSLFTWPLLAHPGSLLRGLNDPFLFTWILNWAASHLSDPGALVNANIFYPYGNTYAYSEPLLVPAVLTAAPILKLTGNPVLAHNLTLLIFQALGGWAACYATTRLTGSLAAGLIAGIAFSVSPFRTGYYNYLNVHMQFAIPLTLLSFALFLEQQTWKRLLATALLFWAQMATIFYGGVPLSILLALFLAAFLLLRPRLWKDLSLALKLCLMGGIVLILLAPVLWPYYTVFKELGLERSLKDVHRYSADWYSFFDVGKDHNFYQLANSGKYPGFFPGFTVYLLAGLALISLWREEKLPEKTTWMKWMQRILGGLITMFIVAGALMLIQKTGHLALPFLPATLHLSMPLVTNGLLILGFLALGIKGWTNRQLSSQKLTDREWIMILGLLTLFFTLFTLGPEMHIQGKAVGPGLYGYLYKIFLPLHTIRLSIRLGYMPVLLLAMLAAFGLSMIAKRIPKKFRHLVWLVPVLVTLEYVSFPLTYRQINWNRPPAVYDWLQKQERDFAILEWPTNNEEIDSKYVFWSLKHNKMGVSGVSGFFPPFTRQAVLAMTRFPSPASVAWLRQIYPLKYLAIHADHFLKPEHRDIALSFLKNVPEGMRIVKQFGTTTVYSFEDTPELLTKWERTFSSAFVRKKPVAVLTLSSAPDSETTIAVTFNGRPLISLTHTGGQREYRFRLPGPYPAAERCILRLEQMETELVRIHVFGFRLE